LLKISTAARPAQNHSPGRYPDLQSMVTCQCGVLSSNLLAIAASVDL
jgi:hypothetical protein